MSRRVWLQRAALGASVWIPAGFVACGPRKLVCTDISNLTPDEQIARANLMYADNSPDPAKRCDNCMQFKPTAPNQCGACNSVKGPIHPGGYCTAWAQHAAP